MDVQSASTLAMLQEEELDHGRRKGFTHSDQHDSGKFTPKSGSVEKGRNQTTREGTGKDDKLSAPIANRKKLGLCFKCGDKWSHNHKCPQHVPLHMLEEILDAIEPIDDCTDEDSESTLDSESPLLAISDKPDTKQVTRRTMKLLGSIGKQQVLILVNSGSIGTFVNSALVQKLQLQNEQCPESSYKSASGGTMICNSLVPQLPWLVQGHGTHLPLRCKDIGSTVL